jgi:transposase
MTGRRIFRPEEKLRIVLEGMSGTIQVSELCRKHDINTRQFYIWKKKLISSGEVFSERGRKSTALEREIKNLREENIRLKDVIAEITLENLDMKKKIGERLQRRGQI